jgi:AP endonuclease 2
MRILSWNVNGIKTIRNYHPWTGCTFDQIMTSEALKCDILCIQEVKSTKQNLTADMIQIEGYTCFYSLPKSKGGYSGVATFVRNDIDVLHAEEGIANPKSEIGGLEQLAENFSARYLEELDSEGRCLITDHGHFVLFNLYCPNGDSSPERMDFKLYFCQAVQLRADRLIKMGRNVIIVGDINVCAKEIDHCDLRHSVKEHKIDRFEDTPSRAWFNKFTESRAVVDMFRHFNPKKEGQFTVWNTKVNARCLGYNSGLPTMELG